MTAARPRTLVMIAFTAIAFAGCTEPLSHDTGGAAKPGMRRDAPDAERSKPRRPRSRTALAALEQLRVKGRAPMTGYGRERFGDDWAGVNGCSVRERVLARDLGLETYARGSTCDVQSGLLADPYTATAIRYVRGDTSNVDVDHVVALGDAWQKGAQQWTYERRLAFANDPLNLLAVDASANRQKGDGDAATWLPANKSYRCAYVARQIAVKRRYRAWVTAGERDAMGRVLARCPDTPLPRTRRLRTPQPPGPVFTDCDAVRAAGRAPLRRGDSAYAANPRLDGDKDGVACEP
jgi:uncharacterized protein DUF1524/excalibur calcium-binding domain-containing protein